MSFRDYQNEVDSWVKKFNPPYWPALEQFAHLAEEVGEVGRELNNLHGIKKKRPDQEGEGLEESYLTFFLLLFVLQTIMELIWTGRGRR